MTREEVIKKLEAEIERTDCKTERECGGLLKEVAGILLPSIEQTITFADAEINNSAGRTDLVIIGDSTQPHGETRKEAYLWELKAPQIPLFEIDTNNRAKPTADLYDAENQLLHYHNATAIDGSFRERWGILSSDHVKFGGIIIGRKTNFFKRNSMGELKARALARQAWDIRERIFYRYHKIQLLLWDSIIIKAYSLTENNKWIKGELHTISVEATSPISWD